MSAKKSAAVVIDGVDELVNGANRGSTSALPAKISGIFATVGLGEFVNGPGSDLANRCR